MAIDSTGRPEFLFAGLDEKQYQSELALLDRYHAFSGELLRIALIGIAAFGFILKETFIKIDWSQATCWLFSSKIFAAFGVAMFGLAAACALGQRFFSTEGVRFFFYSLRLNTFELGPPPREYPSSDKVRESDWWLEKREISLARSERLKAAAAIGLGLASLALSATFVILLAVNLPLLPTK